MSAQKTMNMLFNFVMMLASCWIVLGYDFQADDVICGKGNSDVTVFHQFNDEWIDIDQTYIIHARAVMTYADAVANIPFNDLQVRRFLEFQKIERHNVSQYYIHPNYNPCNGSYNFAILVLETPFSDNYSPVCLTSQNYTYDCHEEGYYKSIYATSPNDDAGNCKKQLEPLVLSTGNFEYYQRMDVCSYLFDSWTYQMHEEIYFESLGERILLRNFCNFKLDNDEIRLYYHSHHNLGKWCKKDKNNSPFYWQVDEISEIRPWIGDIFDQISKNSIIGMFKKV